MKPTIVILVLSVIFFSFGNSNNNNSTSKKRVGTTAKITGKVTFNGQAPLAKPINMSADKVCNSMHSSPISLENAVIAKDGGFKWVFVYLKEGVTGTFKAPAQAVEIDQKGCQYIPHVVGVMTGQKVMLKNSDALLHNLHATPANNPEFNKAQPMKGKVDEVVFNKPEIMMPLKCDVHPWMSAKINVVTHPFFAVSSEDGSFTIPNLPAGTYTIAAVSEKFGEKTEKITIKDGETKTLNFVFSK